MLYLRSLGAVLLYAGCGSDATPCRRDGDCGAGMRCDVGGGVCLMADGGSFDAAGRDSGQAPDGGTTGRDAESVDSGGSSSDAGTSPFDAAACVPDPVPPAPGPCPEACTGGCAGSVCNIDCMGDGSCDGQNIVCPVGYACSIVCDGVDACDSGSIECPPMHACTIVCRGGNDACGDQRVTCGDASCSIECAADACDGAQVACGSGPCTATCGGTPEPTLDCGAACLCAGC
jgi:hypothetical protein